MTLFGESTISTNRVIAFLVRFARVQPAGEDLCLAHGLQHVVADALAILALLVHAVIDPNGHVPMRVWYRRYSSFRLGYDSPSMMTRALRFIRAQRPVACPPLRGQLRQRIDARPHVLAALGVVRG